MSLVIVYVSKHYAHGPRKAQSCAMCDRRPAHCTSCSRTMPLGTGRVPVSLNNLRNHLVRLQKPQVKLQSIMEREGNPDPEVMGVGNIDVIIRRVLVQVGMVPPASTSSPSASPSSSSTRSTPPVMQSQTTPSLSPSSTSRTPTPGFPRARPPQAQAQTQVGQFHTHNIH